MNPATIPYMLQILLAVPKLVTAGLDVIALVQHGTDAILNMQADGNRGPTDAEWEALNDILKPLHAQMQLPLEESDPTS